MINLANACESKEPADVLREAFRHLPPMGAIGLVRCGLPCSFLFIYSNLPASILSDGIFAPRN